MTAVMGTGVTSRDIVSLLGARARRFGPWPAFRCRPAKGAPLEELSWAGWFSQAQALANFLRAVGVVPGDRVALLSRSSPTWLVADMAVFMAGAVSVPLPSTGSPYACRRMLEETRPRLLFAGSPGNVIWLRESWPALDARASVVVFEASDEDIAGLSLGGGQPRPILFADAMVRGRALMEQGGGIRPNDSGRAPEDAATIVYSAGRTGPPRGAVLSHESLVSKLFALRDVVVLPRGAVQLLWLPLDTIFGRLMAWAAIDQGATTWIGDPRAALPDQLDEVRPHFLAGVPRIFEQLRDRILSRREGPVGAPGRATLVLAEPFLRGEGRGGGRKGFAGLDRRLAQRLFRTRVRHLLGGRIRHLVCGGGILDPSVTRLFGLGGLPILEGYGSNETVGVATANRVGAWRAGSVGANVSDVDLRLSPSGEVLLRGRGLFTGYLRSISSDGLMEVEAARDAEGWFHTRDLGLVEDGHLFLTGRDEDILRLFSGRSVAASPIETALTSLPRVKHAVLCGENRPHVSALLWLTPPTPGIGSWPEMVAPGSEPGSESGSISTATDESHVRLMVQRVNQSLERHEQIRAFLQVHTPLTAEAGELSTRGEPVRSVVYKRFRSVIDEMYPEP